MIRRALFALALVLLCPVGAIAQLSTGTVSLSDTVGATGTLNALSATASVPLRGQQSVGVFIAAGTLVGSVVPEVSFDGGTTWTSTFFDQTDTSKVSSISFLSGVNSAYSATIIMLGGATNARVRVNYFESGTANATLRATQAVDPSVLFSGPNASPNIPPAGAMQMGVDMSGVNRYLRMSPSGAAVVVSETPPRLPVPHYLRPLPTTRKLGGMP